MGIDTNCFLVHQLCVPSKPFIMDNELETVSSATLICNDKNLYSIEYKVSDRRKSFGNISYTSLSADSCKCAWKAIVCNSNVPSSRRSEWYFRTLRMRRGPTTNICRSVMSSRRPR
jgi:hypothetical protein